MVRPIILVIGAIPAGIAVLFAVSLLTQPEIPFSAAVPEDNIEIEYTVHDLRKVSFGVTERVGADRTEILTVERDGDLTLIVTDGGYPQPIIHTSLSGEDVIRLIALIKETGFMAIPEDTFPVRDDVNEYRRHTVKVTLNGAVTKVTWPEQNATDTFLPPLITHVESNLQSILDRAHDR